jgi:hypothetical protein
MATDPPDILFGDGQKGKERAFGRLLSGGSGRRQIQILDRNEEKEQH